ncbi:hypothetical protein [Lentzea albida]|uniref:Outer membrane channel protein CpnT-like N-terminal domain-containing protein n=1 Tax=Lentzea albida TaxID=65499 RepID=A0A1H9J0D2_9PSEU|nr:hypothetical protein [Lentzea albida]SEQ80310.1 hypothetical protein SAMN04488000_104407 [Lentzea albida]
MGIEMPAEVRWLLPIVVGDSWPEGDETALQRLSEVWKQAATDVDDAMREAEDAVRQAASNMDGEAAEAFKRYWEKFVKGEEATLPKMKDVSEKLATACRNCAMQIEYAKLSIIIALVILAIQIAAMIASAVVSFGASTAGIVPAQLATRAGVQIVFRRLVQQLMQQVGRNLIGKLALQVGIEVATSVATDLSVQGIQLAKGTRDSLDTSMTLDAAKSGLISGVVGAGVGAGAGKAFGDGVGDSIGRSIGRNAAEEAVIGAGSALAEGALSEEGVQVKDVLFGATSGAVSGSVTGTKTGIEGMNAGISVPTAGDMPSPAAPPRPDVAPRPDGPPPTAAPGAPEPEAATRRAGDATNTSYAAPPTEQPQHRATPDPAPASSSQPQGFSQSPGQTPGQSAPAAAPPASNAPAAPRTSMPSAQSMGGGSSSPTSPASPGGHPAGGNPSSPPVAGGHSPGGTPSPISTSAAGGHPSVGGPSPAGSAGPSGPAPSHSPSPTSNSPASSPVGAGHSPGPAGHAPLPGAGNTPLHHGPGPSAVAQGPAPGQHPASTGPSSPHPATGPLSTASQHRVPATDAVHQSSQAPAAFAPSPHRGHQDPPPQHHPAPSPQQHAAPQHRVPAQHQPPPAHRRDARPQSAPPRRLAAPQQHVQPPRHVPPAQQHHTAPPEPNARHTPSADRPRPPAADTPQPPHHGQTRTPLEEFQRRRQPVPLPDDLRHLQDHVRHSHAGLSLHTGAGLPRFDSSNAHAQSADLVKPDPNRYTVDIHGSADSVRIGDTKLTPKDLADIIRTSGDWDGEQPIRLLSCQTGTTPDGFAARLSAELGVEVVAPTKDAWVDDMGNVFASSRHLDPRAGDFSPGWPPNGDWATYRPDGTSTRSDHPFVPGTSLTWGDRTPARAPRASYRGEPLHWDRDGRTRPLPAPVPPHQVRHQQQHPNQRPGYHPQQGVRPAAPPFTQPTRQAGPPPGGQPNRMSHGPARFPNQQTGPVHHGGQPARQHPHQHSQQHPPRSPQQHPQHHPQRHPNQQPGRPAHPQWQGDRPGPHRPTPPQQAPRSFGPDPRRVQPQHHDSPGPDPRRFQEPRVEQPHVRHAPEQQQVRQHEPAPQHDQVHHDQVQHRAPAQQPAPPQQLTTEQGLPWMPLEEQLRISKDNPITPVERALRDKAFELHMAQFTQWNAPTRSSVLAEFQHHKVGLDGRFVKVDTPPPPRPAKLTADFMNDYMRHVGRYGSPQGVLPSFAPGSDDLPPNRTRRIPHGALTETAVPVHGSQVCFNREHSSVIWVDQRDTFLRPENAVWRRTGQPLEGMMQNGIPPRGTSGSLEAHVANDTFNSALVSFTTELAHALEREAGKSSGIQDGVRVEHIAEAYHPFGIDSDSSHHDAGKTRPHDEHERSYPGGMPRENIYRFWRVETEVKDGYVVSSRIVGPPVMNRYFKYASPEGS